MNEKRTLLQVYVSRSEHAVAARNPASAKRKLAGICLALLLAFPTAVQAQRTVNFPPAESKPPPPVKAPPRTQAGGEDTGILPDYGPSQRKTQDRSPPPPTTLTVMYKVEYGDKLKYVHPDGTEQIFEQWKSYPSDGDNLISYSNSRLNDGNNYKYATKPLASPGFDPVDIPILFMTGDYDFTLKPAEVENLRKFIVGGGTMIFNAARGRDDFNRAVIREMRRVFPQKQFMRLSLDHPIFNARYRIQQVLTMVNGVQFQRPPEVYSLDVGTRAAIILVPGGMGAAWSATPYHPAGKHIIGESAIRLGVNLVAYSLGSTEYGKFLAQEFPTFNGRTRAGDVLRFAAVRYQGSWDVNPAVQNSLLQGLKENTNIDVHYEPNALSLDDPQLGSFPLIFITGHFDFQFSKDEADKLARHLERGGMLVASSAAGLKPFDKAFKRELKKVFPDSELIKLPPSHPLFTGGFNPIDRITYTPTALKDDPTLETPDFYGLFLDGRLTVIYSPFDLMSGLNRESNAYARGVTPDDAARLVNNIITYALSH